VGKTVMNEELLMNNDQLIINPSFGIDQPLRRVPHADRLLVEWATEQISKKFEWGLIDCATITLQSFEILYGKNIFPELKGWKTEYQAIRVMKRYGQVSQFLAAHGFREVPVNYAQTGDVVILKTNTLETSCPVIGGHKVLVIDPDRGVSCQDISRLKDCVCMTCRDTVPRALLNGVRKCHK